MSGRRIGRAVGLILALLVVGAAVMTIWAWVSASAVDVAALDERVPTRTAMMLRRAAEARAAGRRPVVQQSWVPYDRIAPILRRAVLVAEDDAFFQHGGLDWNEIRASARRDLSEGRLARGGSTITQQLAKNLWLGPDRTPWRKLEEVFLALRLERTLSKRRIFELYLNLIEWGDGVYGIEAASRHWFGCDASDLDARQAIRLAAVIVNPRRYSPADPSRRIAGRVRIIASRLHRRGVIDEAQYRDVVGLPSLQPWWERMFSPLLSGGGALPPAPQPPAPPPPAADSADSAALAP